MAPDEDNATTAEAERNEESAEKLDIPSYLKIDDWQSGRIDLRVFKLGWLRIEDPADHKRRTWVEAHDRCWFAAETDAKLFAAYVVGADDPSIPAGKPWLKWKPWMDGVRAKVTERIRSAIIAFQRITGDEAGKVPNG